MRKTFFIPIFLVALSATAQNYALSLNGTNNYVSIGTPLASNTSYTKEAWVYQTSSTGAQNIVSSLNTPFWINGGILSAGQAGTYSLVTDGTTFPLNTWVHIAVTYDAATTTMKLYRDGILVSTNASVAAYTSENTFIGTHQSTTSFFQGNIDEVRIWNTALTQAQIKQNMYKGPANNATGLVAYYKCNEGSGLTLISSCTNTSGLDGTVQNGTTWVASPVQFSANAISFDGTNDFISVADDNTLDIATAITLEAWCYAVKNTGIQNVICKSSSSANNGYIFPRTDNGWANVVLYLYIGGWKTLSAAYPSLNAWHHLAATYDGATMKLYIDGVLAASQAQTGSITTNTNVLALGNQTGFSEYFGGSADEIRIWNVARTQAEIQNDMNKELDPATQTGLVSYYYFNQGIASGTNTGMITAVDQKGNNNGTLTNFALSGSSSNFVAQKSGLSVLPLQWLSFTVQKQGNNSLLKWSTANEKNTKSFTVQHSANATVWNTIGEIEAAGGSVARKEYSYLDKNPANGVNYYRILQTDIDGRNSYSDIRSIEFYRYDKTFTVLNNPVVNGVLQIKLRTPALISLYTNDGRLLWQKKLNAGTAAAIDVSGYTKGTYLVKANEQTEKIIVQ